MYDFDTPIDRGPSSQTHSFKWQGYESRFPGFSIDTDRAISMWVADMDFETPDEVKQAIVVRAQHGIYGYVANSSIDAFCSAACGWFARRWGWTGCQREWMLFFPGVVPAIYMAVQAFTQPGEGVVIQQPVYYPFAGAIADNGRTLVNNPLRYQDGRYTMDFDDLQRKVADPANRLMVLCSPHNPVGRVWDRAELERAIELCAANDVVVFVDEIHADLVMPGHEFFTAGRLADRFDNLVLAHAPSKTFNLAGLASSLVTVPNAQLRATLLQTMRRNNISHGNTFGPIAGAAAYNAGDAFVDELVAYIHGTYQQVCSFVDAHIPGARVVPLEGTYLVWVDFSGCGLPEEDLYHAVIEQAQVVGDLGRWFGAGGECFMRFNLATQRATVKDAFRRIAAVL